MFSESLGAAPCNQKDNRRSSAARVGEFINKRSDILCVVLICVVAFGGTVFAADAMWNTVRDLIGTWVTRLGGVVIFIGGVMFGLGWKNDDAEGKSRGVSTMIAGAIVTALSAMVGQFF